METTKKTKSVDEAIGYIKAMNHVIIYLKNVTEFNPDRRYIDSVELIEFIQAQSKKQSNLKAV